MTCIPQRERRKVYPLYHIASRPGARPLCGQSRAKLSTDKDGADKMDDRYLCQKCLDAMRANA